MVIMLHFHCLPQMPLEQRVGFLESGAASNQAFVRSLMIEKARRSSFIPQG